MKSFKPSIRACSSVSVLMLVAGLAQAQQAPDAGTLLQQQPSPPAIKPAPVPSTAPIKPADIRAQGGPSFVVRGFRFTGASLIPERELQVRVEEFVNLNLNMLGLQAIANDLTGYYLEKGYLARVVVPQQDVRNGIVEMRIIEALRGSLRIDNKGQRVDSSRVAGFIDGRLAQGAPFNTIALDEAVAILNEQPGLKASTSLQQGTREAETNVVVSAEDTPLWSGAVGLNDHGGKASGKYQAQGLLSLNNPTGRFDSANMLVNASEGNTYLRGDYNLAVGDRGLRLGAHAARLEYEIIEDSLRPLGLNGAATTYGITASYPLARTNSLTLNLTGSHDVKELIDRSAAGETGNRDVSVTGIGISGSLQHLLGERSVVTSFGAGVNFGKARQRNAGALALDAATRRTNGSFAKLGYTLANLGQLDPNWRYSAVLRGQFAGENLDSTERMSLGGLAGVRAYPTGEATGDEAWLLNLNLRRSFGDNLAATFFYDAGGVTLNHTTWTGWNAGNPNLRNRYTLAGIGAALDWRFSPAALFSATVAAPVGKNPGRDANGLNADGSRNRGRVWLSVNAQF